MPRIHADELNLDKTLVRPLLAKQFPEWADLSYPPVGPSRTVNAIFRLGNDLSVRLARREGPTEPAAKRARLAAPTGAATHARVPVPVAQARPTATYPGSGTFTPG